MNLSRCLLLLLLLASKVGAMDVKKTEQAIIIDAKIEQQWQSAQWYNIDKHILGEPPSKDDFSGRFKLLWDEHYLYLLAEITDDVLYDAHPNPIFKYWDDDSLEIFIDEDKSGGNHQFNFNAFAYHIALDNQSADIGPNNPDGSTNFVLLNDHINSKWQRNTDQPNTIVWEVAIAIYDDKYQLNSKAPIMPVTLQANKVMGFMLAYCDNDGSIEREHFIGNIDITPINGDKNLGFIDASVFGEIILKQPDTH